MSISLFFSRHRRKEGTASSLFVREEGPTVSALLWLVLFVSPLISMRSPCGSIVARHLLPRSPVESSAPLLCHVSCSCLASIASQARGLFQVIPSKPIDPSVKR